jgi:hypothetical protein
VETLDLIVKFVPVMGPAGIVLLLWYLSDKSNQRTLAAYREDTLVQQRNHEKALAEVKQMYLDNVELVKDYHAIADGLQSLIVLNTQTITRLCYQIEAK